MNADFALTARDSQRPSTLGRPVLRPREPLPSEQTAPKVVIKDASFFYKKFQALKNINLTLHDKRVTAFIGPSGCGKSTLLRILNRIYELYPGQRATGVVLVDGQNILSPGLDVNLLRARIGMVFQKPTTCPMVIYG